MTGQIRYLNAAFQNKKSSLPEHRQNNLFADNTRLAGFVAVANEDLFAYRSFLDFLTVTSITGIIDIRSMPVFNFFMHTHVQVSDYIFMYNMKYIGLSKLTNQVRNQDGAIRQLIIRDHVPREEISRCLGLGVTLLLGSSIDEKSGLLGDYINSISSLPEFRGQMHRAYTAY